MTKSSSSAARAIAVAALICGFLAIVIVVAASLGGGSGSSGPRLPANHVTRKPREQPPVPAAYVVQTGDTLTSIAHKTGVSVARIQTLNPGVDPQILISGEKLKLR
jgi:LysM repeat protein